MTDTAPRLSDLPEGSETRELLKELMNDIKTYSDEQFVEMGNKIRQALVNDIEEGHLKKEDVLKVFRSLQEADSEEFSEALSRLPGFERLDEMLNAENISKAQEALGGVIAELEQTYPEAATSSSSGSATPAHPTTTPPPAPGVAPPTSAGTTPSGKGIASAETNPAEKNPTGATGNPENFVQRMLNNDAVKNIQEKVEGWGLNFNDLVRSVLLSLSGVSFVGDVFKKELLKMEEEGFDHTIDDLFEGNVEDLKANKKAILGLWQAELSKKDTDPISFRDFLAAKKAEKPTLQTYTFNELFGEKEKKTGEAEHDKATADAEKQKEAAKEQVSKMSLEDLLKACETGAIEQYRSQIQKAIDAVKAGKKDQELTPEQKDTIEELGKLISTEAIKELAKEAIKKKLKIKSFNNKGETKMTDIKLENNKDVRFVLERENNKWLVKYQNNISATLKDERVVDFFEALQRADKNTDFNDFFQDSNNDFLNSLKEDPGIKENGTS